MKQQKTLRVFLLTLLVAIMIGVVTYLTRIIFARNLTVEEYGLFYAVYAIVFFFGPFSDLGLGESSIFHINKYIRNPKKIKSIIIFGFVPQLVLGLIAGAVLLLFKNIIIATIVKNALADMIFTLLIVLFIIQTVFVAMRRMLEAVQRIVLSKVLDFVNYATILLVAFFLFKMNLVTQHLVPAVSFLWAAVVTIVVFGVVCAVLFRRVLREDLVFDKHLVKELFRYAIPIMFSTAGGIILTYSDTIMLTLFKGVEPVAYYNIAYPAIFIILTLITPLTTMLFPKISNLYHKNKTEDIKNIISTLYNNALIVILPASLVFFVYADLIIATLFGAKFLAATNTLRIFAIAFIFISLRNINFAIIAGIGKPKERSIILYIGAGFNIVMNLVFIPLYGAAGAALATGLGFLLMAFLTARLILRSYPLRLDLGVLSRTVLCSFIFLGGVLLTKKFLVISQPLVEAVLVLGFSGLVYVASLFLFRVVTKEKLVLLRNML